MLLFRGEKEGLHLIEKMVIFDNQGFSTALKRALEHELDYKKRYGR